MRIGVLAQYLHTRNDVTLFINHLSKYFNVTVFLRQSDQDAAGSFCSNVEVRCFSEKRIKYKKYIWDKLFKLFGKLPVSVNNYFITEEFKLANAGITGIHYIIEKLILSISGITPKFISYKYYLRRLVYEPEIPIADMDTFLCITQIYDDAFYATIQSTKRPVINYVYSWDHPCKMKCFIDSSDNYYGVWSESIANDLTELQHIKKDKVFILGATQFVYLSNFLSKAVEHGKSQEEAAVYFAFATGTEMLIRQEIEILRNIIAVCTLELPFIKFRIRPYPFVKDKNIYQIFSGENVFVESHEDSNTVADKELFYDQKYSSISRSFAFLHFGTTLALEAAALGVTPILCDMASEFKMRELNNFIHQYQNDKYLNLNDHPVNRCVSLEGLVENLRNILNNGDRSGYCHALLKVAVPEPADTLRQRFSHAAEQILKE